MTLPLRDQACFYVTNKMVSTKLTFHKERSLAANSFILLKIYF